MEEDEEVIFEGSPLQLHLQSVGFDDQEEFESRRRENVSDLVPPQTDSDSDSKPPSNLEVEIAQRLLDSSLMVAEDEDFLHNYILNDKAPPKSTNEESEEDQRERLRLRGVLMMSGSLVALAGTLVVLLGERTTHMTAAATAALLPTALAVLHTGVHRITAPPSTSKPLLKKLDRLLKDMTTFKILMKKTLNLLRGMELVNSGYLFPLDAATGGLDSTASATSSTCVDRVSFPALRSTAYDCTLRLINAYRDAVKDLFRVSPLEAHADFRGQYIAFVSLDEFHLIERDVDITVRAIKDVVELALIQQSEYLRRFALVFCRKVNNNDVDETAILKHVKDLIETIRTVNGKLKNVFEYHRALGISSPRSIKSIKYPGFVPIRSVYTSLFSTGLHLQNSLLKVRKLESIFDRLEARKEEEKATSLPDDRQLLQWLQGFQEIQSELNACVGCLEEGLTQVKVIRKPTDDAKDEEETEKEDLEKKEVSNLTNGIESIIIDDSPIQHLDQVFEAVIDHRRDNEERCENTENEIKKDSKQKRSETQVMMELKNVLVERSIEMERREAKALARDRILNDVDPSIQGEIIKQELALVMEQINDLEEEIIKTETSESFSSSGSSSPTTVKSLRTSVMSLPIDNDSCIDDVDRTDDNDLTVRCLSEHLRSLSTPDLKSTNHDNSNPYETLQNGHLDKNDNYAKTDEDSSDAGSADEMERHVLKTFKRPLRPGRRRQANLNANGSSYLNRHKEEDLIIPPSPPSSFSAASFTAQIKAKASAFKSVIQQSEKVFGNH